MNYTELLQSMTGAIRKAIMDIKDRLQYDRTFKAKVTGVLGDRYYTVLYRGKDYKVLSSLACTVGDHVYVCAPCNNWNDLFIISRMETNTTT